MVRRFGEGCEDLEDNPRTDGPSAAETQKRLPCLYKVRQRPKNDTMGEDFRMLRTLFASNSPKLKALLSQVAKTILAQRLVRCKKHVEMEGLYF
jgi:hypothetical protein